MPVRPGLVPDPAVPVVRRVDVAARLAEILGDADAPADPLLLPVRILLLRAHGAVHVRHAAYPADPADIPAEQRADDQLLVHHAVTRLQHGRLPGLAPRPVRPVRADDEAAVRLGARSRAVGHPATEPAVAWQPTGTAKRKTGTRRVWVGITLWNGGTSVAWVLLALWRVEHYGARFGILLATGLLACAVTAMALLSRRNQLDARRSMTTCGSCAGAARSWSSWRRSRR